jgi:DNA-binding NarL/FixJ family response regulator
MAGKSILIVDDSQIITERLQTMLEGLNNIGSIECAGDYPLAIQLLMNASFDIVLLDINLPGGNGIDLLRHIKAAHPQSNVIMFTNQAGRYYRDICIKLGADYFMDKSTEFEDTPLIVSSLL